MDSAVIKVVVDVGLVFEKDEHGKQECRVYVDSDYDGDLDKRRFTTGYVFTLSQALMSWCFTLQSTMALSLSTTKAEYMTLTEDVKEAIWLQGLMDDLGVEQDFLKVNCDSMSVIYLAKDQVYHATTKHVDVRMKYIDVRYYLVRDLLEGGNFELEKDSH